MEKTYKISYKSICELADKCKNNCEDLELISSIIESIVEYHRTIIRESLSYDILSPIFQDQRNYEEEKQMCDKARSSAHNFMLQNIVILNNLAKVHNLPVLYEGEISEKPPFRRYVADATLKLLVEIIENRS